MLCCIPWLAVLWRPSLNRTSEKVEKATGSEDNFKLKFSSYFMIYCRDGDKMAPSVEKKIAELEMGLLHLQQNIDIPEITLPIHATVTAAVRKSQASGSRPKVQDFGDKVEDSTYLNTLQNGVNRWIREIQKVNVLL